MTRSNTAAGRASWLAKTGALAYGIWALLHYHAAWSVYQLGQSMHEGMERGRVLQDAWHLLCFSTIAMVIALSLNWRNDLRGWWINFVVISAVDLGFIFFILTPGHVPLWPGLAGPLFWVMGFVLTSFALRRGAALTGRFVAAGTEHRGDTPRA